MEENEYKMMCMQCNVNFVRDCNTADYGAKVYCSNCNDYVGLWKIKKEKDE